MSNQLKMADIQAILSLRAQGRSFREIARQLGVHRETAARYVRQAAASSEPASALPGSHAQPTSKPATALPGSSGALSQCEPWREVILTKATAGLTARRIWQDLRTEVGCSLSYYSICRFVRKLSQATPLPMRRMECLPGEEAQVDFGTGEVLFEIIMRRYETRSTLMTSNRPLEDWGKLIGDVPSATAILDRFLHHAEVVTITGRSYRLRNRAEPDMPTTPDNAKPAKAPTGSTTVGPNDPARKRTLKTKPEATTACES